MSKRFVLVFLILITGGCASKSPLGPPPPPYLLHLPGIGGERGPDRNLVRGLRDGGFTGEIETYDWTDKSPGLSALVSLKRNQAQAQIIADKLVAIHRAAPGRAILLTAHSGGTGLAVWALEKLPADVHVDRVVLLSSALSPGYDLSPALRHVDGRMYNFWSSLDTLVLSVGTTMFGTIDGVKAPAAGFVGFTPPPTADATQYRKLEQIPYNPSWLEWKNNGSHIGVMSRSFATHVLAPLVQPAPLVRASAN